MTPGPTDEDYDHDPCSRREFLCLAGLGVAALSEATSLLPRTLLAPGAAPIGAPSLAGAGRSPLLDGDDARFAAALALAGETALVGLPPAASADGPSEGRAELLARSADGWTRTETLRPFSAGGQFGRAAALGSDWAVVGAPLGSGPAGPHGGHVAVFVREDGRWTREATLTARESSGIDGFGATLAADGDRLLVGAPGTRSERAGPGGAAHLFRRTHRGWTCEASFEPRNDAVEDAGHAVALAGDTALVAARGRASHPARHGARGVVHVYRRAGGRWTRREVLAPPDEGRDGRFGAALATSGSTAVVSAPVEATHRGPRAGAVHVFDRRNGRWRRQAVLRDGRGRADGLFGAAVAADSDAVLAADGGGTGAVLFTRYGYGWREAARWPGAALDPEAPGPGVALDGVRALVAAGEGQASSGVAVLEA